MDKKSILSMRIKILNILLIIAFMFSVINVKGASKSGNYAIITSATNATVVEVIDTNSILVKITQTGEYALVRMIGVNNVGYRAGFEYVTSRLTGSSVLLVPDENVYSPIDRWNNMYVYSGPTSINNFLIYSGYAKINTNDIGAKEYKDFVESEKFAKSKKLGVWNIQSKDTSYAHSRYMVNINTATRNDMVENLKLEPYIAQNIIDFRRNHPFKNIYQLKYVEGISQGIFNEIRYSVLVCLNINNATQEELMMLINITEDEARKIIDYRDSKAFYSTATLYTENLISRAKYDSNRAFICTEDKDYIGYAVPNHIVNVNKATESQLKDAGFTQGEISKIIEYRKTYSFKTMLDLQNALNLSKDNAIKYMDNISFKTDINNAKYEEIKSLFGKNADATKMADKILAERSFSNMYYVENDIGKQIYDKIKYDIYISENPNDIYMTDYININKATTSQMIEAGFTQAQNDKLRQYMPNMPTSKDVPYDLKELGLDNKVSLTTNINSASPKEIKSLSIYFDDYVIDELINYRNDQPFGSLEEFDYFLQYMGVGYIYNNIKDVITIY